jgi:hypothetical protein
MSELLGFIGIPASSLLVLCVWSRRKRFIFKIQ